MERVVASERKRPELDLFPETKEELGLPVIVMIGIVLSSAMATVIILIVIYMKRRI